MSSQTPPAPTHAPPPDIPDLQTYVYHAHDLLANTPLAAQLMAFVNAGYDNHTIYPQTHWERTATRFSDVSELHSALGPTGLLATACIDGTPVASASAARWSGDMDGVGGAGEEGWEIKAVTTKAGFEKRGLAGRCIAALTEEIARGRREEVGGGRVRLWVHAVEEVNGGYWRRRGWREVRGFERPVGYWGSRFGFRLVVMVKEVDVEGGEVLEGN